MYSLCLILWGAKWSRGIHLIEPVLMCSANPEEFDDTTDQFSFKKMLPRDERRFKMADLNGDQAADREEFTAFLHPEEFDHMKGIVVQVSLL